MPGIIEPDTTKRLILCFDGTGNHFQGDPGDTNIVKLYGMFDRCDEHQMHYYQPGIGTYPAEGPVNVNWFRAFMRKIEGVLDKALATSFDSHVIAGYKFIMRYYKPGDRIYVFGFSRGAYTARFLARMIAHIGLLSMGNEELVPFAYKVYQDYERSLANKTEGQEQTLTKEEKLMTCFKKQFCRTERQDSTSSQEDGVKVHFLGLFDCVSSVRNLDVPFFQKTAPPMPAAQGTARYIRHAVAIDERRVKFKAALFSQELNGATTKQSCQENIKEVWFPGNHGDIGGGWKKESKSGKTEGPHMSREDDYFQLSDIALKWMVDEIDSVDNERFGKDSEKSVRWSSDKADFLRRFEEHKNKGQVINARMHDTMSFGGGSAWYMSLVWKLMEHLPFFIKRWEYVDNPKVEGQKHWVYQGWPPNRGGRRDIPAGTLFHNSTILRMRLGKAPAEYRPRLYQPNNDLEASKSEGRPSSSSGSNRSKKTYLSDLAERENPKSSSSSSRKSVTSDLQFEHVGHTGSNCTLCVESDKWDYIYRVVDHSV